MTEQELAYLDHLKRLRDFKTDMAKMAGMTDEIDGLRLHVKVLEAVMLGVRQCGDWDRWEVFADRAVAEWIADA